MDTIISFLFAARDTAHMLHLRTKSFAEHVALNELYDQLLDSTDTIAELYQGKYGVMDIKRASGPLPHETPLSFVMALASWVEITRNDITDNFILNEWDTLVAAIYKAKYKIENLK